MFSFSGTWALWAHNVEKVSDVSWRVLAGLKTGKTTFVGTLVVAFVGAFAGQISRFACSVMIVFPLSPFYCQCNPNPPSPNRGRLLLLLLLLPLLLFVILLPLRCLNSNRSDWKSQSASESATKIASKSVAKGEEIAAEIAVIQITTISNRQRVQLEIASDLVV